LHRFLLGSPLSYHILWAKRLAPTTKSIFPGKTKQFLEFHLLEPVIHTRNEPRSFFFRSVWFAEHASFPAIEAPAARDERPDQVKTFPPSASVFRIAFRLSVRLGQIGCWVRPAFVARFIVRRAPQFGAVFGKSFLRSGRSRLLLEHKLVSYDFHKQR